MLPMRASPPQKQRVEVVAVVVSFRKGNSALEICLHVPSSFPPRKVHVSRDVPIFPESHLSKMCRREKKC